MRKYRFADFDEDNNPFVTIWTEQDIMSYHYIQWAERLTKRGKSHLISYERCLEDWIVDNWAEECYD